MDFNIFYRGMVIESFSAKDQNAATHYAESRYKKGECKMLVLPNTATQEENAKALADSKMPAE